MTTRYSNLDLVKAVDEYIPPHPIHDRVTANITQLPI